MFRKALHPDIEYIVCIFSSSLFAVSLFHSLSHPFWHLFWWKLTPWFCKSSWRKSRHTWMLSFLNSKLIFQTLKWTDLTLMLFRGFQTPICHLISHFRKREGFRGHPVLLCSTGTRGWASSSSALPSCTSECRSLLPSHCNCFWTELFVCQWIAQLLALWPGRHDHLLACPAWVARLQDWANL